jgi:hypothetical protein
MLVAGLAQVGPVAPSPPPLLLLEPELELEPLLLPLSSPVLPLLEPLPEAVASSPVLPLLEPLLLLVVPPPLLLLQPWAKENEAATVRIEVVMRMRRSMVLNSPWDFGRVGGEQALPPRNRLMTCAIFSARLP